MKNALKVILSSQRTHTFPFVLTLIYFLLEYGRPQESIPELSVLRLPALSVIFLGFSLLLTGKWTSIQDKQTKLFILLLALMTFHIPLAVNNYWAFHVARAMGITFIAYLAIISFVESMEKFKALINIWIAIHVYLAITGIMKGGRGIGGFLGDENDFSMTLNMVLPYPFFMVLFEKDKIKKIIYSGLTALFLFINVLTLSRGGFIGLVAVAIYCWLRSPRKIVSAILIGLFTIFIFHYAQEKYWDEVRSITEEGVEKGTGEERVYQWKIGWLMFLDNPVLGVGQGNFSFRFREYEVASGHYEGLHGRSRAGRAAHSLYFTLLPELGIAGTLIFLLMFYKTFKDLRVIQKIRAPEGKEYKWIQEVSYYALAMEASLIAYLVSGAFISILYYSNFWLLMAFVIVLKRNILKK